VSLLTVRSSHFRLRLGRVRAGLTGWVFDGFHLGGLKRCQLKFGLERCGSAYSTAWCGAGQFQTTEGGGGSKPWAEPARSCGFVNKSPVHIRLFLALAPVPNPGSSCRFRALGERGGLDGDRSWKKRGDGSATLVGGMYGRAWTEQESKREARETGRGSREDG
jgi:hypothetical protein